MKENCWRICIYFLISFFIFANYVAVNGDIKFIRFEKESRLGGYTCPDEHVFNIEDNLNTLQCLAKCADSPSCFGLFRSLDTPRCVGCQMKYLWTDNAVTSSATIYYRRRSFKLVKEPKTFNDSKNHCKDIGGHLVDIKSMEENAFIQKLVVTERRVWLGANDLQHEDDFVWDDGSKVSDYFDNWYEGQPTNLHNAEHCVEMFAETGKWNDESCGKVLASICEFD